MYHEYLNPNMQGMGKQRVFLRVQIRKWTATICRHCFRERNRPESFGTCLTQKIRGVSFLEGENLHKMTNGGNPQGFGGFPLTDEQSKNPLLNKSGR